MRNALLLSLLLAAALAEHRAAQGRRRRPSPRRRPSRPRTARADAETRAATGHHGEARDPGTSAGAGGPAATPPPVRRAPAPSTARGGMAITVTDATGATIPGVRIAADGPTQRSGETNGSGQANFPGSPGRRLSPSLRRRRRRGVREGSDRAQRPGAGRGRDAQSGQEGAAARAGAGAAPPPPAAARWARWASCRCSRSSTWRKRSSERKQPRRETLRLLQRQHAQHAAAAEPGSAATDCTRAPSRCST